MRRREAHIRLVGRRAAAAHEQQPRAEETQDDRGPPVLAVHVGAQHTGVERLGTLHIVDDEQVGQLSIQRATARIPSPRGKSFRSPA